MTATDQQSMFSVPMPPTSRRRPGATPTECLSEVFGYRDFRGGQGEVVEALVRGGDAFVVMPTGGGKSLCFQVPALVRPGLGVVVSPLVSLMKDQVDALRGRGIRAGAIKTPMAAWELDEIQKAVRDGSLDILYVAPERLQTNGFRALLRQAPRGLSLIAVDESHLISTWGHDFRPSYLAVGDFLSDFGSVPAVAVTATADQATQDDIVTRLGMTDCRRFVGGFDRPNIRIEMRERTDLRSDILAFVRSRDADSGIVFCSTRKKAEELASYLAEKGVNALPYHAALPEDVKKRHQERFLTENPVVAVATVAFGMGIDKANVRYVLHCELPTAVEAYYQEIGRAGRDGLASEAVAFASDKDATRSLRHLRQTLDELPEGDPSRDHVMNRISKLQEMHGIFESARCRRQNLLRAFGEEYGHACANCDRCLRPAPTMDATAEGTMIVRAVAATGQNYGPSYVADILQGIGTEKIVANEHDRMTSFGQGTGIGRRRLLSIMRQMRVEGLLAMVPGRSGMNLTDASWDLLRGRGRMTVAGIAPRTAASTVRPSGHGLSTGLMAKLVEAVAIRDALVLERGVAKADVADDRALERLISAQPATLAELASVEGFGGGKAEDFGARFTALFSAGGAAEEELAVAEFSLF